MSQQTEQRRKLTKEELDKLRCSCPSYYEANYDMPPCPVHEPDTYEMWQVEQDMERLKEDLANDD